MVRAAGVAVAVTNSTFRLAPWADLLYAADASWWLANPDSRDFAGLKATCNDELPWPEVHALRVGGKDGFDADPARIRTGGNSGYQAVHVAAQAGAWRVVLLGFDMHGSHWHGPHPSLPNPTQERFDTWLERFETLAEQIPCEVINCTPGSALNCFPRADLSAVL